MDDQIKTLANVALLQETQINQLTEALNAVNTMFASPDQTVADYLAGCRAISAQVRQAISQVTSE